MPKRSEAGRAKQRLDEMRDVRRCLFMDEMWGVPPVPEGHWSWHDFFKAKERAEAAKQRTAAAAVRSKMISLRDYEIFGTDDDSDDEEFLKSLKPSVGDAVVHHIFGMGLVLACDVPVAGGGYNYDVWVR